MARGWPAGKPRGPQSDEHRARITESNRRTWAEQRPWLEMGKVVNSAVAAGDKDQAAALFYDWLENYETAPEDSGPERPTSTHIITPGNPDATPHAKAPRPSLTSRQRHAATMLNRAVAAIPELDDATATRIARELREIISMANSQPGPDSQHDPYAHIPSATQRAAARRQAANRLPGQRIQDAASVPYVGPNDPRHPPMTGRHVHDHSAGNSADHDDGIHSHEHEHHNDADHRDHDHDD